MKRKSTSATIALYAVFTALCAAFLFLPYVFLIPLILMVIFMDFRASVYISFAFAIISISYAFIKTGFVGLELFVALAFREYPLIAIIPRLFIGPTAYGVKTLMKKLTANSKNFFLREILPYSLTAATATLTNTVLVVGSFALFAFNFEVSGITMPIAIVEMLIAGSIELAIAIIVTPGIVFALKKADRNHFLYQK
ncbi:MAG TPA: hypothetical protein VIL26_01045 [Clostridia bacterium]